MPYLYAGKFVMLYYKIRKFMRKFSLAGLPKTKNILKRNGFGMNEERLFGTVISALKRDSVLEGGTGRSWKYLIFTFCPRTV